MSCDLIVTNDNNGNTTFAVQNGAAQRWAKDAPYPWRSSNMNTEFTMSTETSEWVIEEAKYHGLSVEVSV